MGPDALSLMPSAGVHTPTPGALLYDLSPRLHLQRATRHSMIVQEGECAAAFLMVAAGWLSQSKTLPDGETEIIDLLLPGDFALIAASDTGVAVYTVEALTDARFVTFGVDMVNGPEPTAARLRAAITQSVIAAQARTAALMLRLGRSPAATRIAFMLLVLYARLEAAGSVQEARFAIPLNQEMIGRFTGLSNVHVCRTLRRFARDGVARSVDSLVEILDIDALCGIAGLDFDTFRSEILMKRCA